MYAKKIFGFEHFSSQIRDIEKNCLLTSYLHERSRDNRERNDDAGIKRTEIASWCRFKPRLNRDRNTWRVTKTN